MPVHDLGYRSWNGALTTAWSRWWVIARSGLRIAWKSNWIKRLIFVAWMPVLYWGLAFFMIEQAMDTRLTQQFQDATGGEYPGDEQPAGIPAPNIVYPDERPQIPPPVNGGPASNENTGTPLSGLANMPFMEQLVPGWSRISDAAKAETKNEARHILWSWLLMSYFRYPQGMLTLFLIGLTVPPLISRDLRSRAFLLYFSRPINRAEYIIGKLAIPATLLTIISTLPALTLYVFGVLLSPDLSVLYDTWDIPLRILGASACLVIPTSCLSLMLSSLTHESRFAAFAWFTIWGVGAAAWGMIYASMLENSYLIVDSPWQLISFYNVLGNTQRWIFGETNVEIALPSFIILFGVTAYSVAVLYRRISAPIEA